MLKYILFDLDGTLTDSEEGITKSVDFALRQVGIETADLSTLTPYIGPPLVDGFMQNHHLPHDKAVFCKDEYRKRYEKVGLFENRVYDGIPEALAKLQAEGFTLALATSKPEVFARRILDRFALSQYFDEIGGATMDGRIGRKHEVITETLRRLGDPTAEEVLMVGDRLHDIEGAHRLGLRAVGVLFGFGSKDELTDAGADYLAETPAAMAQLVLDLREKGR